jgi:hypothetical protein
MFDGYFRYKSCRNYFVYSAVPDCINVEEVLVQYIHQGLLLKRPSKYYTATTHLGTRLLEWSDFKKPFAGFSKGSPGVLEVLFRIASAWTVFFW